MRFVIEKLINQTKKPLVEMQTVGDTQGYYPLLFV